MRLRNAFRGAFAVTVVSGVLAGGLAQSTPLAPIGPVDQAKVRALDLDAVHATQRYAAARAARGSTAAAAADVKTAEDRVNQAMHAWSQGGAAVSCTLPEGRARAFAEVSERATIIFRRAAGTLHTSVPDLRSAPRCAGDITMDRMVGTYFEAIGRDDLAAAADALGKIDQQLSCMSVRQVHRASVALKYALERTETMTRKHGGACEVQALGALDQAALNLVYRTFERSLPYGKTPLDWMSARRSAFMSALSDPRSILSRMRIWVGERATPDHMEQLSAACRAGSGGRSVQFAGPSGGATCDPLAAFIRSLGAGDFGVGDCRGGDLAPLGGAGGLVSELGCHSSCDALSALGSPGRAGTMTARLGDQTTMLSGLLHRGATPLGGPVGDVQRACGSFGGGGAGGAGAIGGTQPGAAQLACMMNATPTSPAGGGSLLACMTRGLASGALPSPPSGGSMRRCTLGTDPDDPDSGGSPAPAGSGAPASTSTPTATATGTGTGTAPTSAPTSTGTSAPTATTPTSTPTAHGTTPSVSPTVVHTGGSGQHIDLGLVTQHGQDSSHDSNIRFSLDDFSGGTGEDGNVSVDTVVFGVCIGPACGGGESCSSDGSCPTGCTGTDRFTQTFQTCAEQQDHRTSFGPPPNTDRPGPPNPNVAALTACFSSSSSPSVPGTCPTMNCPGDMEAMAGADGHCTCGHRGSGSTSHGSTASAGSCATMRCGEGQTPTPVPGGCVCQNVGTGTGTGPGAPTSIAPMPGGASRGGLPGATTSPLRGGTPQVTPRPGLTSTPPPGIR